MCFWFFALQPPPADPERRRYFCLKRVGGRLLAMAICRYETVLAHALVSQWVNETLPEQERDA